jgi:putative salt-induced outer membrane protein YdiY
VLMKSAAILSGVLLLASSLAAREKTDVVVLRNGDKITGEIKGLSAGVLRIDLDYVDGTLSVHWLKVARIESSQLFIVKSQDGSYYTGTLSMSVDNPGQIQILEVPLNIATLEQSHIVNIEETAQKFLDRWSGDVSMGLVYSKGNRSTQNTFASGLDYRRERWGVGLAYNSNLSSSSGADTATRNQFDLSGFRLLPWRNYYCGGIGTFLQSSVLGIDRQTTLGGGIGRYFKNTNRAKISVLGGLAWQTTKYETSTQIAPAEGSAAGLIATDIKIFVFKKTNLSIRNYVVPALSQGRVRFNANASYYLKLFKNLNWNLSFYGNWDTQPPPGFAASDFGYSVGISWKFGYR